ncbi:MAG TPA: substrate-binding domain-containing protein [Chthoniobacterales bacterium]|jgi:ribose transport system substrate-binding protein|nr:substrate-binding domain-containing protein [Chthoniobacterales bacterium]
MNTKKVLVAMILAFTAASLSPIGLFAQGAQKQLKVGLVLINLQAKFFNDIRAGAEEAAKKAGVSLQVIDGNNDPAAQVNAVETLTQQKMDGIIMVAIDVKGIVPALQDAAKSGVKVVAVDAKVQDPSVKAFIGVDNAKAGSDFGDFVGKYIEKQMGGKAKLGIIGALNSFIQNQRKDNFIESIKKIASVTIGNTVDGQNVQERALTAAEDLVTSSPDTNVIYATGEPALIGAIAALESQGATRRVKLFGWDLSNQALKAVDDGFLIGVVQQNPYQEGIEAIGALVKLSRGEEVPSFIDVPVEFVTKDNIDKYRAAFQ